MGVLPTALTPWYCRAGFRPMATSAIPVVPGAEESSGVRPLSRKELERLVDQALEDERLKAEAGAVGLQRLEIVELAGFEARDLARVPLDLSGALAQRHRESAVMTFRHRRRERVLTAVATIVLLTVWGLIAEAAFLSSWMSSWAVVLLVAIGGTLISWGIVAGWRSSRYASLRSLRHMEHALKTAEDAIEHFRVAEITQLIRTEINERDDEQYRTNMKEVESRGLAEIEDPRLVIETPAGERLERLLGEMPGGSIGISGPRGVGKSSLIRATCPAGDNQPSGLLGVRVAAPVQFDAREFILHLFAELCRTIIGWKAVERLREPDPFLRVGGGVGGPLVILQWLSLLVLLAGVGMLVVYVGDVDPMLVWAILVTLAGLLGYMLAAFVYPWARARNAYARSRSRGPEFWEREDRFGSDTIDLAGRRLTDIWFQQTFTSGWSGSINLPIGVEGGLEGGRELAQQQMSMPDIVSELRNLVLAIKTDPRGRAVQVRFGIDELDKMDSIDDACKFLNEIKVLFGIPRCFFLVSLSEDAMSQFERRGLPIRDVFDSSFDDVVRAEPLAANGSVALLRERTIGMPIPFMLLCHCMGGGLPRDVIRMAREIVPRDSEPHPLSEACRELVASQIAAKVDATLVASRRELHTAELERFQGWLEDVRRRPTGPEALIETCRDPDAVLRAVFAAWPPVDGSDPAAMDLPRELVSYCYFCATVQEFFVDDHSPAVYRNATWGADDAPAVADELAAAHQAFAVGTRAAWEATTRIRERLGFEPVSFPESKPPPTTPDASSRLSAATSAFVEHLPSPQRPPEGAR